MSNESQSGMTPVMRNLLTLLGFALCIFDIQLQEATDNIFAGNFMPDQAAWLTGLRYSLCAAGVIFGAMVFAGAPRKNLGSKRAGFIFFLLVAFCLITAVRSAMDIHEVLYLFATGSRHILTFALIAMASSLPRLHNFARPVLIGAAPAFLFRYIYSTYQFVIGDGVEIIGGVRSVALDTGFMIFGIFYLFGATTRIFETFKQGKTRASFLWLIVALLLLFLPLASFRRATIFTTVMSLLIGFFIHAYVNRVFIRHILPITAINVLIATVSLTLFFAAFGPDVAMERLRSYSLHDEGDLAASNEGYERDFDYAAELIKRNPIAGIGFSTRYGLAGREDPNMSGDEGDIVLHVGMAELVVRQGIFGILVWLVVFIWLPLRRIVELRSSGRTVALLPCFFLAFFVIAANLPTSPPFYNEVRPAIFLGIALGIAFTDDPTSVFDTVTLKVKSFRVVRAWVRQEQEPELQGG